MVAHRKNVPTRKAYVPSGWFILLTVMLCIGGAGWLGLLLVGDDDAPVASPTTPTPSISVSPDATESTPEPTQEPTEEPTEEPTAEPTDEPATARDATVSVLNNSGIAGAARVFSGKVSQAGWPLGGIGNWTGSIGSNTVYYPPGLQAQAELLGQDVGITRIRPSVAPMRMDRLTIILSGPQ
ncbi:LytR C-terminal domain-containing protein [Aeromicrobium stalagmiti]|uniref:LytR C-terminal domain-containing protein n=1 Tax=Aeromicrobium stalagmiti TaxID=2738988 RepID=UPI001C2C5564|nr:LytR C-terminal domain-containing protein [Aeromicrobium stalagmiti]